MGQDCPRQTFDDSSDTHSFYGDKTGCKHQRQGDHQYGNLNIHVFAHQPFRDVEAPDHAVERQNKSDQAEDLNRVSGPSPLTPENQEESRVPPLESGK